MLPLSANYLFFIIELRFVFLWGKETRPFPCWESLNCVILFCVSVEPSSWCLVMLTKLLPELAPISFSFFVCLLDYARGEPHPEARDLLMYSSSFGESFSNAVAVAHQPRLPPIPPSPFKQWGKKIPYSNPEGMYLSLSGWEKWSSLVIRYPLLFYCAPYISPGQLRDWFNQRNGSVTEMNDNYFHGSYTRKRAVNKVKNKLAH